MAVPDYQSVMLPLLQFAAKKEIETSTSEAVEALAKELSLTEDDLKEMLPSGIQSIFVNRVGWASTYMKKAGLFPKQHGEDSTKSLTVEEISLKSSLRQSM
ncbi:MAG: winged helix-turn-helix domain-containing protein [Candidatus Moduliflexus flocculans]|nr:winged helix-turn-helix domain-containing protein [Candidatus Moduliflexus flocculans]